MRMTQQVRHFATAIGRLCNLRRESPTLLVVDPTRLSPAQERALVDAGALRVTVPAQR